MRAWRDTGDYGEHGWAKVLAKTAGCSERAVRGRRKLLLNKYNVDIKAPFALYRGVFGIPQLTDKEGRAMISVIQNDGAGAFFGTLDDAAKELLIARDVVLEDTLDEDPLRVSAGVATNSSPFGKSGNVPVLFSRQSAHD